MLDFGFSEILLTSAIALVVLGPERLPKVARQVGNWMGRARVMARQLSEQLEREVSADELLKEQKQFKSSTGNHIADPYPVPPDPHPPVMAPAPSALPPGAASPPGAPASPPVAVAPQSASGSHTAPANPTANPTPPNE